MANNRMFLRNTRTGRTVYVAKYYPSTGWYLGVTRENIDQEFEEAEFSREQVEERADRGFRIGMPEHLISGGGMFGAEWVLEYDVPPEDE